MSGEENAKYPLITDGVVQQRVLDSIDKDEEWLQAQLEAQGFKSAGEVFLAEYESGNLTIVSY